MLLLSSAVPWPEYSSPFTCLISIHQFTQLSSPPGRPCSLLSVSFVTLSFLPPIKAHISLSIVHSQVCLPHQRVSSLQVWPGLVHFHIISTWCMAGTRYIFEDREKERSFEYTITFSNRTRSPQSLYLQTNTESQDEGRES